MLDLVLVSMLGINHGVQRRVDLEVNFFVFLRFLFFALFLLYVA